MNEQQSQTFFVKVDSLSTIRNNKLISQGEKLEPSQVESFCIDFIVAAFLKWRYARQGILFFVFRRL